MGGKVGWGRQTGERCDGLEKGRRRRERKFRFKKIGNMKGKVSGMGGKVGWGEKRGERRVG